MEIIDTYIPVDRRQALAKGEILPDRTSGAVLFADISGFTHFNRALYQELGPKLGADEITQHLNHVYSALIDEVDRYGGSVISFGGDAITCWFDKDNGRRATGCALDLQKVINRLEKLTTPSGDQYPLEIKVAVTSGRARRFLVGQPRIQRIDVLAGEILDRMAAAEKQLKGGEVIIGSEVMGRLGNQAFIQEWRKDDHDEYFAVVTGLSEPIPYLEWSKVEKLDPELAREWLLPPVYQRLIRGEGEYLAELRSAVAIFLKFQGINYDQDEDAGLKLDKYICWVQSILAKYEGFLLDLNMGDKGSYIFSAFGARVSHEDDVDRALYAASELFSPPQDLNFIHSIQIGITRGLVRVGAFGSSTRRTYGAQGKDITLASRLMDKAAPGQILASGRIMNDASPHFEFEELEPIHLKGLDEPFPLYQLIGGPQTITTDILGRSIYPLVGREVEKAIINHGLEELRKGRSATILIDGDAGMGKSRLVEYAIQCADQAGISLLIGAGDEIEKSSLYYAWRPVFKQIFDFDSASSEQQKGYREGKPAYVAERLSQLAPTMDHLAPLLNSVLPVDILESDLTRQMTSEVRAGNIREMLVALLCASARSNPLVLILEDGHWMDSTSWAIVRMVTRDVCPLMLVIALRPIIEPVPLEYLEIKNDPHTQLLELAALPAGNIETLVSNRLGVKMLPQAVLDFIQEKAEGNPFFSEELAYALRFSGFIQVEGGECRLTSGTGDLRTLDFPDVIQDIIRSRIDLLAPQEQMVLKVASAIGRIFPYRIVYDIHPIETDKPHLLEYLDILEKAALTRLESPEPDLSYSFKHIITQEVAYDLMLYTQRRELHQSIAKWYESTYSDDLSQVYSLLAYHWEHTENAVKAVAYLEKAGEQAVHNFANKEAVMFLSAVLKRANESSLEIDPKQRANWEFLLGEAYVNRADYIEGRRHIEAGLVLLGQPLPTGKFRQFSGILGQVVEQVLHRFFPGHYIGRKSNQRELLTAASRACERLVEVYFMTNETALSLYTAFKTLNLAESAGPSPELVRGYGTVGALVGFVPLHGIANNYLHHAFNTVNEVNDLNARTWVNITAAFYYAGIGKWQNAQQCLEEAIDISLRLGDMRRREDGLGVLFALNYFQGFFNTSVNVADELIRISQRRQADHSLAFGLQGKAYAMFYQGEFSEAMQCLEALHSLMTVDSKISDEALLVEMYGLLGMARLHSQNIEGALNAVSRALEICSTATPSNFSSFSGYAGPAYVYLSLWEAGHDHPHLDKLAWKACKTFRKYDRIFPIGKPRAFLYTGTYLWLSGKRSEAQNHWKKSLQFAEDLKMRYEQGLAHRALGEHLLPETDERRNHLVLARAIFDELGAKHDLKCVEEALSGL